MMLSLPAIATAQTTVEVRNADFAADTDYYWTADKTYNVKDMLYVKPGSRLFIEAGTVVKFDLGTGNAAKGLVVTRGAQIFAEGTADRPIIMTSVQDNLNGNLDKDDRGLWGGLIVLGAARTNNPSEGGLRLIEGLNEIANPQILAEYGGSNDDDNSGVIRYVSIRHTGIAIGDVAGNEIQGLTMGGVGRGTTVEYVESFASDDDGFEWFGGTVDGKYLVSAFNSDDAYDWDEGFRGRGQFWFAIQAQSAGGFGRGMELDGAIGDETGTPFTIPVVSNLTILGAGTSIEGTNAGDGSQLLILRDNSGGKFYNSIFAQQHNTAISVEDVGSTTTFDSRARLEAGDIVFRNNIWHGFGAGAALAEFAPQAYVNAYLGDAANANRIADPQFRGISRTNNGGLDPRPAPGSPALDGSQVSQPADAWFTQVKFTGAFGGDNWMKGWTALDEKGYLSPAGTPATVEVRNADFAADTDYYWTADKTYNVKDMLYVKPGSRLFIEAGTVVKFDLGTGNAAKGLVVTRGAQIFAEGTADRPIIMTSVQDNLNGNLDKDDRGLWGGLIVLGAARTNNPSEGGLRLIEGLNEIANPQILAEYGGSNDDDNSGVIRYVSIRHTGIAIGDVAGNEIQGLTMGGVGRGTTVEYVESFASDDDGFEWFGGTVDGKYLVSAFNSDDAYDWDEGFRGRGQFWFAIQAQSAGGFGRGMELDGAIGDETGTPFTIPVVSNLTILGAGTSIEGTNAGDGSQLLILRDNSGGKFYNSIFAQQHNTAISVEDVGSTTTFDSRARLEAGDIVFRNNIWHGFGAGAALAEFAPQAYVNAYLGDAANANRIADPQFRGISRTNNGGLDPRPAPGSPANTGMIAMADTWFDAPEFVGAFGRYNWMKGWTALDEKGYLVPGSPTDIEEGGVENVREFVLTNYPNPFNPTTTIAYTAPANGYVSLTVYDLMGRMVAQLVDGQMPAGRHTVMFDASGLASGVYVYRLQIGDQTMTQKMLLMK
jgi:hypothetical protein